MHMYCDQHPDALAEWSCIDCGTTACGLCVKTVAAGKVTVCPSCGGMMSKHERLKLGAPTEFWAAIDGVFTMPFGAKSVIQLVTASALSAILWVVLFAWTFAASVVYAWFAAEGVVPAGFESKPAAMALVLILVGMVTITVIAVGLYGYLTNYSHFICNEASDGSQSLPIWADFLTYGESCVGPAMRGLMVLAATMGPAGIVLALMMGVSSVSAMTALAVTLVPAILGFLVRPIVFLRMSQFESFSGLSSRSFEAASRHLGQYMVILAVQFGALAPLLGGMLYLAISPGVMSFLLALAMIPITVYFTALFSQIAGVFYRCNRLDFGGV